MFIPNKTYHAMKVIILSVIAGLVTIIAGQFVLYMKMAGDNKVMLDSLQVQVDTLTTVTQLFDKKSLGKHTITEHDIREMKTTITELETSVTELQSSVDLLQDAADMLIVNECKVMPYYMDKRLLSTCKNKGF